MNMTPVAQAVQRQGRGDDTMLVHMTPGEVGGLQALAMAHGGSLSINPSTGLPEAGFLKNILPTLLGVGLSFIPGVGPLAAGMITGGIETVRTGDIGKGFMAGLGAYGGANLAGGLMSAGTAANAANVATAGGTDALAAAGTNAFAAAAPAVTPTQQLTTRAQNIFSSGQGAEAARTAFMGNVGGMGGLATNVGMAAAPAIADSLTPQPYGAAPEAKEESTYAGPYTPTERRVSYPTDDERRRRSSEFTYFTPSNPVPFAEGGEPAAEAAEATGDIYVTPAEAKVYQDILNVQRLTGLPAIDMERFVVSPRKGYEKFVYQPIGEDADTKEYVQGLAALAKRDEKFSAGGSVPTLEDGGFVLTKKAVDGLGRGNNKKGQQVASAGLGAISIRGKGAKRGPKAGVDDKIKTTIDGKRPALVSNGEAYVPKKQVAKKGGAKAFYALMNKAEKAADKRKRA